MLSLLVIFVWGGVSINFMGAESGQKQSVKILQNMVYNTTQHTPPPTASHCLYKLYVYFGERGGGQRESSGATVHNIIPSSMGATAR